jgi:hypothetical protein
MTTQKRETTNTMQTNSPRVGGRRRAGLAAGATIGCASLILGLSPLAGAATAPTGRGSGASGSVATISGTTMEVQSTTAQTAVSWTPTTAFSETAAETVSAVAIGDCLTVFGTPSKKSKTTVAAHTVTINKPSSTGGYTGGLAGGGGLRGGTGPGGPGGFRGGFGAGGRGAGSFPPAGGARSGGGRGSFPGPSNFAIASGKVTAVSGSTVSLSGTLLSQLFNRTSAGSKAPKRPTAQKTQKLKITVGKSATLSETQTTTSSALAVGDCVSAFGTASSTGAITATTVRISSTGGKTCSTGFGGFGGGFGRAGGGAAGGTSSD